ncbi:MAG: RNA polymerase factor sigma-54 [Proteobacteria bacterium]|nr:RNA polymerase factor sigma-54 [Pseudomonadota bacterium]
MALDLRQTVKLSQQLVMTPQLQQAIKLLQLSRLELAHTLAQELTENPVLEEVPDEETPGGPDETSPDSDEARTDDPEEPGEEAEPTLEEMIGAVDWENYIESAPQTSLHRSSDDRPPFDANLTPEKSLADHLLEQLGMLDFDALELELALLVIGNLNDDGYLEESLPALAQEVGAEIERAEAVLARIQRFDPVGVAARDLPECLRVQLVTLGVDDPLALRIAQHHLEPLQRKDYRRIARIEATTIEAVAAAARVIGRCEPRPGRAFSSEAPIYITPDIFVHKLGDDYHVVLNEDGLPKLRVSPTYRGVLGDRQAESKATRDYVREKLRSAVWLIKSIHQRQRTIVKVMESILRFQRGFFDRGPEALRPLNLRDVADDIGMHESTVSRVTTAKYVQTPHGVFLLKFFFKSSIRTSDGDAVASESVKEKIQKIVRAEDPRKPYSDQKIAEILRNSKIDIARRTVTKYREALGLLSSTRRRQIG